MKISGDVKSTWDFSSNLALVMVVVVMLVLLLLLVVVVVIVVEEQNIRIREEAGNEVSWISSDTCTCSGNNTSSSTSTGGCTKRAMTSSIPT